MTPPPVLDAPKAPKTRRVKRPIRRTPLTVAGFLAAGVGAVVAVVVAVAVLYVGQDAYKAGHQSTPAGAADGFLDAMLNQRSMDLAQGYMCDSKPFHQRVAKLIKQVKDFEAQPSSSVSYLWGGFKTVSKTDSAARLSTNVTTTTTTDGTMVDNPEQTWTLELKSEFGWKVCGLRVPE
ncbi:hypothetical protein [Actinocatenispora rupis]|uniref:Uncharacterized protein n=1 Tax=Actinocatenispora rupis TaxID=519421 RepID=A0A8J3NDH0_9ACTN|nr:hypothetical protein [Actinocatenispora rupis]GID15051.1 hypothetical protein Aru02nite_59400 [Actinocatenispora rupis]